MLQEKTSLMLQLIVTHSYVNVMLQAEHFCKLKTATTTTKKTLHLPVRGVEPEKLGDYT